MSNLSKKLYIIPVLFIIILSYQNCGENFEVNLKSLNSDTPSESMQGSSDVADVPVQQHEDNPIQPGEDVQPVVENHFPINQKTGERDYFLQPFSEDSPWNQTIDVSLKRYKSFAFKEENNFKEVVVNSNAWTITPYLSQVTDPIRTIKATRMDAIVSLRMPKQLHATSDTDAPLAVYDPVDEVVHEFYKFEYYGANTAAAIRSADIKGLGVSSQPGKYLGIRASGVSSLGGLIRDWEMESDQPIRHALAIGIGDARLKLGYIWPAANQDGNAKTNYKGWIPMGSMFTINKNVDLNKMLTNKLARRIAQSLQDYGGYVVDRAGNVNFILFAEPKVDQVALANARKELVKIIPHLQLIERQHK